jgi:sialate O-acetylesterase
MPASIPKAISSLSVCILASMLHATIAAAQSRPLLHELFQQHAVLQRDRPIAVWGDAQPNDQLTISFDAASVRARADASGHWRAELRAMPAGGPHTLSVRTQSGASQSIADILMGDVWLCSGQSNMELAVSRSLDAATEIAASNNDSIRIFSVAHSINPAPLKHFQAPVAWAAAAPETIRDFSAACYYFARELQKSIPVPFGLIHSSWGGSRIEPWISEAGLRAMGGFDTQLDLLNLYARDPNSANKRFGAGWESWWREHAASGSAPWSGAGDDWHAVPEPMRDWKTWGMAQLANHDGMVWFRRTLELTPQQATGAASLSIGAIDEVDETWVNGHAIANSFGYGTERSYPLPAGALHTGENSIIVNVLSTYGAAGMYGPAEHMALQLADGSKVGLGGQWRYQFVPESIGYPPRAPWQSVGGLTSIYNAMISPLIPFGLKGVLWYQGESNASEADHYQSLLKTLMRDWRRDFGAALPFLVVELPNFGAPPAAPTASAWANLREAQRLTITSDPHAALAVTIDVGIAQELHPPNKQAVGQRLARAARHLVYGESISASGPIVHSARHENHGISVSFDDVEGKLVAYSSDRPIGFELCGNTQSSCRFADARIQSSGIALEAANASEATRVRFCWGDAPVCNLFDESGLPAGPFEIAIRP